MSHARFTMTVLTTPEGVMALLHATPPQSTQRKLLQIIWMMINKGGYNYFNWQWQKRRG
jgi:hypothetical protein